MEPELVGRLFRQLTLDGKGWERLGDKFGGNAVVIEHEFGQAIILEIPHNSFGQSGRCCFYIARHFHRNIVAVQHHFVNL